MPGPSRLPFQALLLNVNEGCLGFSVEFWPFMLQEVIAFYKIGVRRPGEVHAAIPALVLMTPPVSLQVFNEQPLAECST